MNRVTLERSRALLLRTVLVAAAACGGGSKDSPVTAPPTPVLTTINVSLTPATIQPGQTATALASGLDQNRASISVGTVVWSSSSVSIATVSPSGVVTAVSPGEVSIIASTGARTGQSSLTVIPIPVASVVVAPAVATVAIGGTQQLSASTLDASGNALTGRAVVWSSSDQTKVTVSSSGLVTGIAAGTVTITATSEGRAGSASLTAATPIASVTISGSSRVKVGDQYTYTATARLADGTVVQRPITWSVRVATTGSISASGVLTPLIAGTITLQVTIEGTVWEGTTTAYDWVDLSSSGSSFATLLADNQITSRSGVSSYPQLVFGCSNTGSYFVWVDVTNFITSNGLVSYSFDAGTITSTFWNELAPNYNTLWHPGASNTARKSFSLTVAAARSFGFAFTEFLGTAKAVIFRVTGLSPHLAPVMAACPAAATVAEATGLMQEWARIRGDGAAPTVNVSSDRSARQLTGAQGNLAPDLRVPSTAVSTQAAVRRPRQK